MIKAGSTPARQLHASAPTQGTTLVVAVVVTGGEAAAVLQLLTSLQPTIQSMAR